jgi:hypothetical protein
MAIGIDSAPHALQRTTRELPTALCDFRQKQNANTERHDIQGSLKCAPEYRARNEHEADRRYYACRHRHLADTMITNIRDIQVT